ncbi:MAG: tRNA (guanine(10)-N(2))-dimethyltransferase [Candidatus Jordarchaeum sp.]|uniref:tRNA (guanine(10)-N(2))-dimethyltransferase n=1 Tax=Candidatus Jordarchaeum sp. TaxID=2823881 RepID=UPI00404B7B52
MHDYKIRIYHEGKVDFYGYGSDSKAQAEIPGDYILSKMPVFYNPVMKLNRDIAVYTVRTYQILTKKSLRICEPLTGCGVRGIRLAMEVNGADSIIINDINPMAYDIANRNVEMHNLRDKIQVFNEDANLLLSKNAFPMKRFDVIDIDPFGSPAPFLDSALRAISKNNGLLCLTATDMAPLCGVHTNACIRKYGGVPLRTTYCHEIAVRLLISCSVLTASKRDIALAPILSHSTDHYIRVYLKTISGAKNADEMVKQIGYLVHCNHCHFRQLKPGIANSLSSVCPSCGDDARIAGPLWCGKIQSREFIAQVLENSKADGDKRAIRLLSLILEEADAPATYYDLHSICDQLNLPCPALEKIIHPLKEKGYSVTQTHFKNNSIRTNAPVSEILKTIRKAQ